MSIAGALLLAEDVRIVCVSDLDADVRSRIEAGDRHYTITRPRSRTPTSVLDADSAELLASFQRPARIVDAVIAFAQRHGRDPLATLDAAYPVLKRLYRMQFLVAADGELARPIDGELKVGDFFDQFELVRRVQVMDDNEVYLACDASGRYAAVKFYRRASRRAVRQLVREARLLRRIKSGRAPALLCVSRAGSGVGLVTEWIHGIEASHAADLLRASGSQRDEHTLLSLCVEVASAVAEVHESGLVHGDLQPCNLLVESTGSVRLIDFGMARELRQSIRSEDLRGGVPFYFEPELAQTLREDRAIALTPEGEQYAVAALIYLLWTGAHYLDWSLERGEMLRQLAEDEPVGFEARHAPPWPALEQVLRRALDKDPQRRFRTCRELAHALRDLLPQAMERDGDRASDRTARRPQVELLDLALERYALGGPALRDGLSDSPFASVNYGAAGIAYALLRVARLRSNPQLLAAADLWSQKAYSLAQREGAFYNAGLQIERQTVGQISLFHSLSGLHCVRALVSAAQGDAGSANAALSAFVEHTAQPCGSDDPTAAIDLVFGNAGLLLACSELIESIGDLPGFELAPVRVRGEALAGDLLATIRRAPIARSELEDLGIAHGWGGLLFSLLRWLRATRGVPDPAINERLRELAALARPSGAGLRWPHRTTDAASMDGWCNGSAGFSMLYSLACQRLTQPQFGELAQRAGFSAWASLSGNGSLCCGQAGAGYALLAVYRLTGEPVWLRRAQVAAVRAASDRTRHFPQDALYKGAVGVALLVEDLKDPTNSAMPLFEAVD